MGADCQVTFNHFALNNITKIPELQFSIINLYLLLQQWAHSFLWGLL